MRNWTRKLLSGGHGSFVIAALTVLAITVASATPAWSQAESSATRPSDTPLPSCLDQSIRDEVGDSLRPRGVQKRPFLKKGHIEIVAHGGVLGADLLSSSYLAGGSVIFYMTEDLGVELVVDVTHVALDLDKPLAEFFGDERFEPTFGYLGLANLVWSPIHSKLKIGDGIVHSDILFTAGAGRLFHESVQGVTFDAGMSLEMYLTGWFTVRFDLRDIIAIQEAVAETRLTNNIAATVGVAFWIPTGL